MYSFLNYSSTNSYTSSFSSLDNMYVLSFLGTKSSLRFIAWSQSFLTGICSDFAFSNTFSHLWNLSGTNSFTFALSNFTFSSNFFLIIHFHSSQSALSSTQAFLSVFSLVFTFFLISKFLPHTSEHLVIFTSLVSQFISRL